MRRIPVARYVSSSPHRDGRSRRWAAVVVPACLPIVLAVGCAKSGMGAAVRTDVTARMATIQAPVQQCYASALERDRKLRGTVVLEFRAAAGTGQFEQVTVSQQGLPDQQLTQCLIDEVGKLKLEKPQKTAISIEYPVRFQPNL
jgi:hypothetical protein